MWNEIISVANIASTDAKKTVSKNVTITVPKNSDGKKVRYKMDCYHLHMCLTATILLVSLISIVSIIITQNIDRNEKVLT